MSEKIADPFWYYSNFVGISLHIILCVICSRNLSFQTKSNKLTFFSSLLQEANSNNTNRMNYTWHLWPSAKLQWKHRFLPFFSPFNKNSMKLLILLHSLYWSIHTKDESKREIVFAFIFGVNWLWCCGVTASLGVFFSWNKM